jgi:large subunit ribosomal protein L30
VTKSLKITQVRSALGRKPKHRRTVRALGLRRIGDVATQPDNPAIRGMIDSVGYLLKVAEEDGHEAI